MSGFYSRVRADLRCISQLFTRYLHDDEQQDKRLLRRLRKLAIQALNKEGPPLLDRLDQVLRLVADIMDCQAATLALYGESGNLVMAVAVGPGEDHTKDFVASEYFESFAELVSSSPMTTTIPDLETTAYDVPEQLRKAGIQSLLGCRMPPYSPKVAVLYVGSTEKRHFYAREVGRLESVGEQLTLHLAAARLFAELNETAMELEQERQLRERFVALIAHDLRGPLQVAKMGERLLAQNPNDHEQTREVLEMVERSIHEMERMIVELLETNRLRAGQSPELLFEDCDLVALVREVADEFQVANKKEVGFAAGDEAKGRWNQDQLKRAIWNLVSNGVKYGDPEQPVEVRVEASDKCASVSVHNFGKPITPEDQEKLFDPFFRTERAVQGNQTGWGLGLTLVLVCAEAHGGKVKVHSTELGGTTFSLELPWQVPENSSAADK